jgi:hypothetical protein
MPCALAASQMIWFASARIDFSPAGVSNLTMWDVVEFTPESSFPFLATVARWGQIHTAPQKFFLPNRSLWIVETSILAVRSLARFASAEMARWNRLAVAFVRQKLDEPRFVLDLLV